LVSFDASMAEAERAAANFDRIAIDEGGWTDQVIRRGWRRHTNCRLI
jgi:hypothetical protein